MMKILGRHQLARDRKHSALVLLTGLYALGSTGIAAALDHQPLTTRMISFATHNEDILHALLRLGSQERLPMGIVFDKTDALCKQRKSVDLKRATVGELMNNLLSDSNSTWRMHEQVIEIRPKRIPEATIRILKMKVDKFGTTDTLDTIQACAVVLSGRIYSGLNSHGGIAASIMSNPDAEKVPPFTLRNASVEAILNHIVSAGSRGAWLLYSPTVDSRGEIKDVNLVAYGYKDDMSALQTASCSIR